MDKLKKLFPEKMLELWNKRKISSVEALSYLIHQVIETQNVQAEYNRKLTDKDYRDMFGLIIAQEKYSLHEYLYDLRREESATYIQLIY